jgi:putative MATE family efflux protein
VLSVIGFFLARPVLLVLRLDPEVVSDGAAYLQIVFISVVPMFLRFMCEGSMQAAGDSVRPMIVTAIYRAVHIALCPFLIFGWWIFPELGIRGAAVTNIITQCLGLGLSLWIMLSGRTKLRFKFELPKLDFAAMGRIIKIGIPATVMGVQMSFGALILISLISPFGTAAVAAHTIWQRIDMVLMMPIMGLGMAAGVLAGQNLGANKPERATRSGWIAALLAEGFMLVAALLIYFIAESLVRLFNSDPELVRTGAAFLRIATVMYLFIAFMPVFQYCISGSGDTLPPMILSIVGTWVIMLPLAFILPKVTNWGVYGIRWAIVTNAFLGTAGFVVYFMSGRWKKKAV